tara:strand:- start:2512 stop:3486 length:975 start_codon:yes stop_codon:yes gene_type:complete
VSRRRFIKNTILGSMASGVLGQSFKKPRFKNFSGPRIISTWNHGFEANKVAWKNLSSGNGGLTAVEFGVRVSEDDPNETSVGLGGLPDRTGIVTLDACIMDKNNDCGSVSFLQNIKNPISVARMVMEKTPHIMLSGKGAYDFAIEQGFKSQNLLTKKSKDAWEKWKKSSDYKPVINIENHDTISMLLIDENQDLFGACTTSGAAWKLHGRVGDSPIIGAGLFLDNDIGAAAATGLGEAVIRTSGSAMVVEVMRQGASPFEACKEIVNRISKIHKNRPEWEYLQVGFIAVNKQGEHAGYSLKKGFNYALHDTKNQKMIDAKYEIE